MSFVWYYIQGDATSIFLFCVILYRSMHISLPTNYRPLQRLLIFLITYFFTDIFWILVNRPDAANQDWGLVYLSNLLIYGTLNGCIYYWFLFCMGMLHDKRFLDEEGQRLAALPLIIPFAVLGFTYHSDFIMTVDNIRRLGLAQSFFLAILCISVVYVIYPAWRCFLYGLRHYEERRLYFSFAFFAVLPTILWLVQLQYWRIPLFCLGCLASVLYLYLTLMESMVSRDPLTRLANRNELNRRILSALENPPSRRELFLFMLDIDEFKGINDTFGHVEGDRALRLLADTLRSVERRRRGVFFPARFGGDEFLILTEGRDMREIVRNKEEIRETLALLSKKVGVPYKMGISIGAVCIGKDSPWSLQGAIAAADTALYVEKRARKLMRRQLELQRHSQE